MNIAKTSLLLLLFSVAFSICHAETEQPEWMNQQRREILFPSSAYYTGFAITEIEADKSIEETLERLKQSAYGDLMSKISVSVQYHSTDTTKEIVASSGSSFKSIYSSFTSISTRMMEIPGIEVKTFVDSEKRMAAMMAYVPNNGLTAKLQRLLVSQMTRVTVRIEDAEGFIASGSRSKAREALDNARASLKSAEDTRFTMLAIDHSMTAEELMDVEWRSAEVKIIALESELNRSVRIFLQCDLEGEKENADNPLYMMLSGELYRNGCILTDSIGEAEWSVDISASTVRFNDFILVDYHYYYSHANATVVITGPDGNTAYSDKLSIKGGHTKNYDYAAAVALCELADKLGEIIRLIVQK